VRYTTPEEDHIFHKFAVDIKSGFITAKEEKLPQIASFIHHFIVAAKRTGKHVCPPPWEHHVRVAACP
jgi:hypothetical protein